MADIRTPIDELVALDDQLRGWQRYCTYCGRTPVVWFGTWHAVDPDQGKACAVAYVLCQRCCAHHVEQHAMRQKLRLRYGLPEK